MRSSAIPSVSSRGRSPRPNDCDPSFVLSLRATEVENEVHVLGDRSSNEVHDETGSGRGPAKGPPVVSGLLDPMPPLGNSNAGRQGDFFVLHVGLRRFLDAIDVLIPAGSIHLIDQEFEPTYSTCNGRLTIRRRLATLNRARGASLRGESDMRMSSLKSAQVRAHRGLFVSPRSTLSHSTVIFGLGSRGNISIDQQHPGSRSWSAPLSPAQCSP